MAASQPDASHLPFLNVSSQVRVPTSQGGWWPQTLCSSCDCWSPTASPYVTEVMRQSQIKQAITNTLSDVISYSVNSQSVSSTPVDSCDCICVQYTDFLSCHYSLTNKASQLILHPCAFFRYYGYPREELYKVYRAGYVWLHANNPAVYLKDLSICGVRKPIFHRQWEENIFKDFLTFQGWGMPWCSYGSPRTTYRGFISWRSQGSNSGHHDCQEAPLPAEPSASPIFIYLKKKL